MRERRGVGVLAALAPAVVLATDPAGWSSFGPVKWLAVSTIVLLGAALVAASGPVAWPRGPLRWSLAGLLGWLAVAAGVGLDPTYAWVGTPERHLGWLGWVLTVLALVIGANLEVARDGRRLAAGLAVAGLGLGALATAEAIGWEPEAFEVGDRLTGTLGSSAYLGAATALLLPIMAGLASDRALPRGLRRGGGVAVPLLAVACIGSGARAAWVGMVAAGLVLGVARRDALLARRRSVVRVAGVGAIGAVLLLGVTPAGERLGALGDPDAPGGRGRLDEWRVAANVIADHPITGVGPEGYRIAFSEGVDARYERTHGREQQPDRAHSAPLDLALAGGIPALLAWVAVVVLVGRAVWRVLHGGVGWIVGVATALVAHLVGQLLLFPVIELEPLAWLLAGLVLAAAATRVEPPARDRHPMLALALGAAAVAALVAGLTDVVADRRARAAVDALERGDHPGAVAAAEDAVALRPDVVRLHVLAATALVAGEHGTLAGIEELDAALDVSPGDPIVLLHRATLLVDRAGATQVPALIDVAHTEVEERLAHDPHNAALWRLAGRVAALRGDARGVAEAAARADDLTPLDARDR